MNRVLEIDLDAGDVVVEPGVTNLDVTRAVAADGFYYAPDPSSQQVCTIGGNVAENSGGAHCLKYGFTVNHVLAAEIVLPDGELVELSVVGRRARTCSARSSARRARSGSRRGSRCASCARPRRCGRCSPASRTPTMPGARRLRHDRRRDPAGRDRDDGRDHDRGGRGRRRRRTIRAGCGAILIVELDGPAAQVEEDLAARRGALPREAGPTEIRIAADADRPRGGLARPQGGVRRDGPRQPELLRPGRRRPAHEAAGGAAAHRRALARSTACASATSSTPATATCIRSCSTTDASRARPSAPSSWPGRSSRRASTPAARSPASTASASTRRARCR